MSKKPATPEHPFWIHTVLAEDGTALARTAPSHRPAWRRRLN
jgi:hypothetical protein